MNDSSVIYEQALQKLELLLDLDPTEADLEEAQDLLRQLRIDLGEHDVEFFGRYYFPEYFENETPDFHYELNGVVDDFEQNHSKYSGLVVAAPRGHAKSVRISFLKVIHWIVYQKRKFVVLISDTGPQAESLTASIKIEFEQNDRLREDFGDLTGDQYNMRWTAGDFFVTFPKQDEKGQVMQSAKGKPRPGVTCRVVARGTGAGMRGLKNRSARPDVVIIDDGENDELVLTKYQRDKVWNWLTGAVIPMLHPTEGLFVVVGTVLHYDSMLSRLLAQDDLYKVKRYKAIKDNGESLWPDRFPLDVLEKLKKALGTLKFNQEYMNDPIDDDTQPIKALWFKWFTKNDVSFDGATETWFFMGEPMRLFQGVDPAISEKESADDFVDVTLGVTPTHKIPLLDVYTAHLPFTEQPKMIVAKYQEWLPEQVGIETNAYQMALKQQVVKDAMVPVKGIHHGAQDHKYTRIIKMTPFMENGQFYLRMALEGEPYFIDQTRLPGIRIHEKMRAWYEQAVTYDARAAKDDILDATENAISIAKPKMLPNEFYK